MICQSCGIEAPTKYVSFHQNIGLLIMRMSKSVEGELCKSCVHKHFWSLTGTTAVVGWWGTISLVVTPFFLLNNIGRYIFCLGMPAVPADAMPPRLTDADVSKISPYAEDLFGELNRGREFNEAVKDTADRAGVTPGQVSLFVQAVVEEQRTRR